MRIRIPNTAIWYYLVVLVKRKATDGQCPTMSPLGTLEGRNVSIIYQRFILAAIYSVIIFNKNIFLF
jgi:hypothetical protein